MMSHRDFSAFNNRDETQIKHLFFDVPAVYTTQQSIPPFHYCDREIGKLVDILSDQLSILHDRSASSFLSVEETLEALGQHESKKEPEAISRILLNKREKEEEDFRLFLEELELNKTTWKRKQQHLIHRSHVRVVRSVCCFLILLSPLNLCRFLLSFCSQFWMLPSRMEQHVRRMVQTPVSMQSNPRLRPPLPA